MTASIFLGVGSTMLVLWLSYPMSHLWKRSTACIATTMLCANDKIDFIVSSAMSKYRENHLNIFQQNRNSSIVLWRDDMQIQFISTIAEWVQTYFLKEANRTTRISAQMHAHTPVHINIWNSISNSAYGYEWFAVKNSKMTIDWNGAFFIFQ